jgi:hypothetical protein
MLLKPLSLRTTWMSSSHGRSGASSTRSRFADVIAEIPKNYVDVFCYAYMIAYQDFSSYALVCCCPSY